MKKTLTVNLAGLVFHIEDDAYEKLKHYLDSIKNHFSQLHEDSGEITQDIEARAAEHFGGKITPSKQVITLTDVNELIGIMGEVADIAGEETRKETPEPTSSRKLFRNPDDMIIAGVCSGLAAFFDIEPLLIRLLFILSIFLGGTGIIIYLVLWLLMPEAKTPTERMEMRGYAVTLSRLEQTIKEKINSFPEQEGPLKKLLLLPFRLLGRILHLLGRFLHKLVPAASIFFGLCLFAAALAAIAALCFFFGGLALNAFSDHFDFPVRELISKNFYYLGLISAFLAGFIPSLTLLISGISFIRRKQVFNLVSALALITIWVAALTGLGAVSFRAVPAYELKQRETANAPQAIKELPLKDFSKIDASNWYEISVAKGDAFKITAAGTTQELERLHARVENQTLKISRADNPKICVFCFGQNRAVKIEITMPELSEITSRFSADFQIAGFDEKELSARLSGADRLDVKDSKFGHLKLFLSGAARANLTGSADNLTAELENSARLEALEFPAKNVILDCSDAALAKVWAQEKLNVGGRGFGRIYYKGEPDINQESADERIQKILMNQDADSVELRFGNGAVTKTQIIHFE